MDLTWIPWLIRAIIIILGILGAIRLNTILKLLQKKHPKLYKKLGKPGVFSWNFRKGFIQMVKFETKLVFKDKMLPEEIHQLARHFRIGMISAILVFAGFLMIIMFQIIG